jgi:putative pyruvate formate lyase activating enzyme
MSGIESTGMDPETGHASFEPSYLRLHRTGELRKRAERAREVLSSCTLCPRCCGINRLKGERGWCSAGDAPSISSYGPHFGEEAPLVGRHGSGTVFMTYCTMRCEYCQNFEISQLGRGMEISCNDLARVMLRLQDQGCHNINFVTPTHFVPQILEATAYAADEGLSIPLVYNTGGYDRVETLRLLEGVFDIYMPDAKYGRDEVAVALSHAPKYVEAMEASLVEMHRQVGDLIIVGGIARRGLLIRHLVLPADLAGSERVMRFIAREVSKDAYVNIMDQYRPMGIILRTGGEDHPLRRPLARTITADEYRYALECAVREGLHRGFIPPISNVSKGEHP